MRILVIGSGGREHAIAWKISQSTIVSKVYVFPGNAGIDVDNQLIRIPVSGPVSNEHIGKLVNENNIDMVVIGPEGFLVTGLVDYLQGKGLPVVGPTKAVAALEGSKIFSKVFMRNNGIPTADFEIFYDFDKAVDYIKASKFPIVIKANGLAGGKGVFVVKNQEEALSVLQHLMRQRTLGEAGNCVVIEEFMAGFEVSFIVLTDGRNIVRFPICQDYKNLSDSGKGPNTGGMGAHFPLPFLNENMLSKFEEEIVRPVLRGVENMGHVYKGFLYCGLMVSENGEARVLEFNCRLGDPETQLLMLLMKGDFLPLLENACRKDEFSLSEVSPDFWHQKAGLCVVASAKGYPGKVLKGDVIEVGNQIDDDPTIRVFHSGTEILDGNLITDGGRVLTISGIGENKDALRNKIYEKMSQIKFDGKHYRNDIGLTEIREK